MSIGYGVERSGIHDCSGSHNDLNFFFGSYISVRSTASSRRLLSLFGKYSSSMAGATFFTDI